MRVGRCVHTGIRCVFGRQPTGRYHRVHIICASYSKMLQEQSTNYNGLNSSNGMAQFIYQMHGVHHRSAGAHEIAGAKALIVYPQNERQPGRPGPEKSGQANGKVYVHYVSIARITALSERVRARARLCEPLFRLD